VNDGRTTRWAWDLTFALVLMAVFAYATVTALSYPEGAKLFPLAIAIPSLVLAVVLALISLRARGIPVAPSTPDPDDDPTLTAEARTRRTGEIALWILGIFVAVYLLGFLVAIPISAAAYLRFAARESWVTSGAVAGVCWLLVFGIFDRLLHLPLPPGELLRMFGIR